MSKYRNQLPQLSRTPFITDGGLETTLIFHHGHELPEFAAFDILTRTNGCDILRDYYRDYIELATTNQTGFILESPTWRANRDWGRKLGYNTVDLREINRKSIALLEELRIASESGSTPMVISGCIGPRGDGYDAGERMTVDQARQYHFDQIKTLRNTEADMVSAFTINYTAEAIGITQAARMAGIPVTIGFTVETDGRLPSGQPLGEAITEVDRATNDGAAYYMVNCAHPTHFSTVVASHEPWVRRIQAVRANASAKSHAELDESQELDTGDPKTLGSLYAQLVNVLPNLNIFGGCCGTDHRHVEAICKAVASDN